MLGIDDQGLKVLWKIRIWDIFIPNTANQFEKQKGCCFCFLFVKLAQHPMKNPLFCTLGLNRREKCSYNLVFKKIYVFTSRQTGLFSNDIRIKPHNIITLQFTTEHRVHKNGISADFKFAFLSLFGLSFRILS